MHCRLRDLNSPTPSTSKAIPITQQPRQPQPQALQKSGLVRTHTQPARGVSTPALAQRPIQRSNSSVSTSVSKDDSRIRDVIMGEVLDTRPSVRWDEVAGLANAKQVTAWMTNAHARNVMHCDVSADENIVPSACIPSLAVLAAVTLCQQAAMSVLSARAPLYACISLPWSIQTSLAHFTWQLRLHHSDHIMAADMCRHCERW